jgi:hypothetical protein
LLRRGFIKNYKAWNKHWNIVRTYLRKSHMIQSASS